MRAGFPSCLFLAVVALSRRRYLARQTTGMRRKEGIRGLTGSRTAALGQDCGACRAEDAAALRGGGVRRVGVFARVGGGGRTLSRIGNSKARRPRPGSCRMRAWPASSRIGNPLGLRRGGAELKRITEKARQ